MDQEWRFFSSQTGGDYELLVSHPIKQRPWSIRQVSSGKKP
jgi:hypothetical protein